MYYLQVINLPSHGKCDTQNRFQETHENAPLRRFSVSGGKCIVQPSKSSARGTGCGCPSVDRDRLRLLSDRARAGSSTGCCHRAAVILRKLKIQGTIPHWGIIGVFSLSFSLSIVCAKCAHGIASAYLRYCNIQHFQCCIIIVYNTRTLHKVSVKVAVSCR